MMPLVYINSSIVELMTFIMTCMYCRDRTRRVTRRTRKVRNMRTLRKALMAEPPPVPKKASSTRLRVTIIASKMFIPSFRYSDTQGNTKGIAKFFGDQKIIISIIFLKII